MRKKNNKKLMHELVVLVVWGSTSANLCLRCVGGMSKKRKHQNDALANKQKEPRVQTPRTSTVTKDYLSDGMSFEAENDCDPDLPLVCLESPRKKDDRRFVKNDVVWVPFKEKNRPEVFWPAVVSSVSKHHINYHWVNEQRAQCSHRCLTKRVISFDDETKNLELRDLGMKYYTDFKNAYDRVTQYFLWSASNKSNAIRFLTYSKKKDGIEVAKDHLFRLGVSDTDDVSSDEDICEEVFQGEEDEEEAVNEMSVSRTDDEKDWHADIEAPLENLSREVLLGLRNEAECLLPIIQSDECFSYLEKVAKGDEISERHKQFPHPDLKFSTGLGPFSMFPDLTQQFLDTVEGHCEHLRNKGETKISSIYAQHVLYAEAVIFATMKHLSLTKISANLHYLSTCKKLGQQPSAP